MHARGPLAVLILGLACLSGCFGPVVIAPGHIVAEHQGTCEGGCRLAALDAHAWGYAVWNESSATDAAAPLGFERVSNTSLMLPIDDITLARPSDGWRIGIQVMRQWDEAPNGPTMSVRIRIPIDPEPEPFAPDDFDMTVAELARPHVPAIDELFEALSDELERRYHQDIFWSGVLAN